MERSATHAAEKLLSRFLIVERERWASSHVQLQTEEHHHLFRVLRMAKGDALTLGDGQGGRVSARVQTVTSKDATLEFTSDRRFFERRGAHLAACVALIKSDRMDMMLEKLCELGVDEICPMTTSHGVIKLDAKRAEKKLARFKKTLMAAANQSENLYLPKVRPIRPFRDVLATRGETLKLIFWARGGRDLASLSSEQPAGVVFATGPEGGLSEDELTWSEAQGFKRASLGPRVLRAESAAITAAAILGSTFGDLNSDTYAEGSSPRAEKL